MQAFTQPLPADVRLMNLTAAVLGTLGVLAALALALGWAVHRPAFALRAIRIEGDLLHNNALTIRSNAAPKLAGNFFTMDLAAGRRAFESVPWVRQAVVQRIWPNRLEVRLQEHRAAAFWVNPNAADEPTDKLVNSFGEVFEANLGDVEDDALPTLRGPEGTSAHMLTLFGRLQEALAPMPARIETLELSGRGSWSADLDNAAHVEFGRGTDDELIERTRTFVSTLGALRGRYQQRALLSADLRHNDGYAVRLKGVSTASDAAGKTPKQ